MFSRIARYRTHKRMSVLFLLMVTLMALSVAWVVIEFKDVQGILNGAAVGGIDPEVTLNEANRELSAALTAMGMAAVAIIGFGIAAYLTMRRAVRKSMLTTTTMTAAAKVSQFQTAELEQVALLETEVGELARLFKEIKQQSQRQEQTLEQQFEQLRIEIDQQKRQERVAEIVDTEYFQSLKEKAAALREQIEEL